jgi:hypothetical protein
VSCQIILIAPSVQPKGSSPKAAGIHNTHYQGSFAGETSFCSVPGFDYIHPSYRWGYSDLPLCCAELTQYRSHPTGLALSVSSKYITGSNGILIITASEIMSGVQELSTFTYCNHITIGYNQNALVLMIRSMLQNCCTSINHREMRFHACSSSLRLSSHSI